MHSAARTALLLLGALAFAASVSPPRLRAWRYQGGALQPIPLPTDFEPAPLPAAFDLDQDGRPDKVELVDNRLYIYTQNNPELPRWQSPPGWVVAQALISDLDRDARPELALLVWRPFQPWPIDSYLPHGGRIAGHHNARGLSCHLVLIGWKGSGFGELWAGSALARPLRSIATADLDGDGQQELVALEGQYTDTALLPARSLGVWAWNGFGFDLQSRLVGRFHQVQLGYTASGGVLLLD